MLHRALSPMHARKHTTRAPQAPRAAQLALCAAESLVLCAIWVILTPTPAYAYVDPSVMTYTIQALAGVAVALSAVAGVVFRRVRRKVFKTLSIDENANKAVEGTIARINSSAPDAGQQFASANKRAESIRKQSASNSEQRGIESLSWPKRFAFSLLMCIFTFFIILVAPALEIFGANSDSLVFGIDNIWWVTVLINGCLAFIAAAALSALTGKRFLIAMLFTFSLTFAAYFQSFFLNAGMMPADGGYINWSDEFFVSKMIVSGLVWLAIIIIPQFMARNHRYAWLRTTSLLAVAIIIMQGVGVASVVLERGESMADMKARPYVTQDGLYNVSNKHNVIVFVLDTYDTKLLEELRNENPDILNEFENFTYFRNSTGAMIPTQNAVPFLLSGQLPKHGDDLQEYRKTRYEKSHLMQTIRDQGYSIDLYTDSAMLDYERKADKHVADLSGNIHSMTNPPVDVWNTYLALNQCALYRETPWVLKPYFWYYTTDVNNRVIGDSAADNGADELYELDDAGILTTLREHGLEMTDANKEGSKGSFKFIHLFGPHFPFNIDEEGQFIGVNSSTQERQALGSLKVVDEYFRELKHLGIYNSSTIIVTADHGIWDEHEDPIRHATSPILLVKPSMSDDAPAQACMVSDAPVSHMDFAPTLLAAMGADGSAYGSGLTVWDIKEDEPRQRYFDALTSEGEGGRRFVEYAIDGDALNLDNWEKTGEVWPGA